MSTTRSEKYPNHSCIDSYMRPTGLFCYQCEKPPEELTEQLAPEAGEEWGLSVDGLTVFRQPTDRAGYVPLMRSSYADYQEGDPQWPSKAEAQAIMGGVICDHRLAVLVPGLFAGLKTLLAVGIPGPALLQQLYDEVEQAEATLNAISKERAE